MILYNVVLGVRTAAERPPFWDDRRHSLLIWIFARDHDHALDRSLKVLGCLPYELVGNKAVTIESAELDFDDPELGPMWTYRDKIARQVGISVIVGIGRETSEHRQSGSKIIQLDHRRRF